ncbi:kinase inhibitor [Thalassotalea insulae]|uniref:Kinase inhibitor n=1 Tax=Thalassotalea insulae TaxID=2056778 RepID=A0ABQ6GPR9_9GAMM|nr:YbhB/YbcL family Raf kinase inhibitor-like protein [Thalassotalea insulae]GLX77314.1 kinase inhibitor [Thalassotalea insulae]
MLKQLSLASLISLSLAGSALADSFQLSSQDIAQGKFMAKAQEFNGFGCTGDDLSPQLKWSGAPEGTKSFAVTAYDPDAPTGSGWWHWQIINIPVDVTELAAGAGKGDNTLAPKGSMQMRNDYGSNAFGGACPPQGHGVHHYRFTVYALKVEQLELPVDASAALTGYMLNANALATSTIEALYQRD